MNTATIVENSALVAGAREEARNISTTSRLSPLAAETRLRQSDDDLILEDEHKLHVTQTNDIVHLSNKRTKPSLPKAVSTHDIIAADVATTVFPYQLIPLTMGGEASRTHMVSDASRALIQREITLAELEAMMNSFYAKAYADPVLDAFIRSHNEDHGRRFATWVYQKFSDVPVWDEHREARDMTPITLALGYKHVVHDRSSAHVAAWYSPKRPAADVGRHFELDECRVWMRLHFWALRESKLVEKSPTFVDYYVRFIAHFVRVYERTAPMFARDSYRWSADSKNIERYLKNGRQMPEIMGLSLEDAQAEIPASEVADIEWPYIVTNPWNPALNENECPVAN